MQSSYIVPIAIVCAVSAQACKPATMSTQKQRFSQTKDRLDVLASKSPAMKADIQAKLVEFDKDFKAAEAKGNAEDAGNIVYRMQEYEKQMTSAPAAGSASGRPTPGASARPTPGGPAAPPASSGAKPGAK